MSVTGCNMHALVEARGGLLRSTGLSSWLLHSHHGSMFSCLCLHSPGITGVFLCAQLSLWALLPKFSLHVCTNWTISSALIWCFETVSCVIIVQDGLQFSSQYFCLCSLECWLKLPILAPPSFKIFYILYLCLCVYTHVCKCTADPVELELHGCEPQARSPKVYAGNWSYLCWHSVVTEAHSSLRHSLCLSSGFGWIYKGVVSICALPNSSFTAWETFMSFLPWICAFPLGILPLGLSLSSVCRVFAYHSWSPGLHS